MGYVALKRLKMGKDDYRAPGEPVPEAAEWRNLHAHIQCGQVALVPDGKEAVVKELLLKGFTPKPGLLPLTDLIHRVNAARGAKQDEPKPQLEVVREREPTSDYSTDALAGKSRSDLNEIAEAMGIRKPDKLKSKAEVIAAIVTGG